MTDLIMTATRVYADESNTLKTLVYRLLKRTTTIGTVYDITCERLTDKHIIESYTGVTQSKAVAVRAFNIIVANTVAPEHLISVIDDIYNSL